MGSKGSKQKPCPAGCMPVGQQGGVSLNLKPWIDDYYF